ncbi:MAG: O-antigen ligase family protein [Mogibacterium sp.]|nr:O-antigen ligase family protein [Mogibacterium sp.]
MAKNKGKNRKKKQSVSRKNEARMTLEDRTLRIDVLAMLPGILMSVMIILILTIDVVVSGMDKRQYTEFPGLFRIMFTISAVAGIIYFIIRMFRRDIELRSTQYGLTLTLFVIFLICICISTIINGLDEKAIHGVPYRNTGVFHLIIYVTVFAGATACIRKEHSRELIEYIFFIAADMTAVCAIVSKHFVSIPAFEGKKEISAVFFNGNHYGYFVVMAVLLSAGFLIYGKGISRIVGTVSIILNLAVLMLNRSSGCLIAVFLVLALLTLYELITKGEFCRATLTVFFIIVAGGVLAFFTVEEVRYELSSLIADVANVIHGKTDESIGHNRVLLWKTTLEYIKSKPIFGYGCEGISDLLMKDTGRANAHCELLSYAAFFGIPAALSYLGAILSLITTNFKRHFIENRDNKNTSLSSNAACIAAAGYFFSSFFGVTIFYTVPFFFIFMGIAASSEG